MLQVLLEMEEHTFTELDSLVDWQACSVLLKCNVLQRSPPSSTGSTAPEYRRAHDRVRCIGSHTVDQCCPGGAPTRDLISFGCANLTCAPRPPQITANMTADYGYWPPTNWSEAEAATSSKNFTKLALATAATLSVGLLLGRLSK